MFLKPKLYQFCESDERIYNEIVDYIKDIDSTQYLQNIIGKEQAEQKRMVSSYQEYLFEL